MPLRPLPYRLVKIKLESAGFHIVSQKGSHVKFMRKESGHVRIAIVPKHKEIAVGTQRSILRQAGLSVDEFENLN